MKHYQICKRCVMDTSDPDIRFNEDGNCNHCETFLEESKIIKPQGIEREQRLKSLIESIKKSGKNKKYDCSFRCYGLETKCRRNKLVHA